jgi:hypothetical protein
MSRQRLRELALQKRKLKQEAEPAGFWPELCQRIADGQVIPIVSNAISNDLIFASLLEPEPAPPAGDGQPAANGAPPADAAAAGPDEDSLGFNAEDLLADAWAGEVKFPLPEQAWLPRVALYVRVVQSKTTREAKMRYLNFLKDMLTLLAEDGAMAEPATIEAMRNDRERYSFADVAAELGFPIVAGQDNPLELLAKLNLPIYMTTSHFDFLERAIIANGRQPRTQICFWSGEPTIWADPSHKTDHTFVPTVERPLVYHIFGLETYVESMVLNEDDYLDFLRTMALDTSATNPIMPVYLQQALTKSSLLLLGYRLRDMEFRVMFRGLLRPSTLRDFNLAIQMDLSRQSGRTLAEQIKAYLEKYFGSSNFTVSWDTPEAFMTRLWNEWQEWRK